MVSLKLIEIARDQTRFKSRKRELAVLFSTGDLLIRGFPLAAEVQLRKACVPKYPYVLTRAVKVIRVEVFEEDAVRFDFAALLINLLIKSQR